MTTRGHAAPKHREGYTLAAEPALHRHEQQCACSGTAGGVYDFTKRHAFLVLLANRGGVSHPNDRQVQPSAEDLIFLFRASP